MHDDSTEIDFLRLSINELQKKLKHLFSMFKEDELDDEECNRLRDQIENLQQQINSQQNELKELYRQVNNKTQVSSDKVNFD